VPIRMIGMVARFGTMRTKVLQELQIGDPTTTRNESAELAFGVACNEFRVCAPALSCSAFFYHRLNRSASGWSAFIG